MNEPNSSLTYYIHFGSLLDDQLRVTASVLSHIITEPAFNVLRTKEQLGYIVFSSTWPSAGMHEKGIRIVVQSERSPVYLEQRVEAFLSHMKTVIEEMVDATFAQQKLSLENKWKETPKNLAEETSRFWVHIDSGYLDFERSTS